MCAAEDFVSVSDCAHSKEADGSAEAESLMPL